MLLEVSDLCIAYRDIEVVHRDGGPATLRLHGLAAAALRERGGGALVGDCGFRCPVEDPRQGEIGITLAPEAQGKGLAAEALRALLEYLFVRRGMHRVFGSVDPENRPCRNLLHRVGMRQEAHFVSSQWFKGAWVDDLVFAMLEREHEPTGG